MKRVPFALLALALLAGCPPKEPPADAKPAPAPSPVVIRPSYPKVALPDPENPVVAVRLAFRTGSIDDPKGKEGVTALTVRLMAEGGTNALSSAELQRALYPMATGIGWQVDKEMTVFYGKVHKDHLAAFLPILADVVLEPRMDPKEFERLRTDALNDLTLRLRTSDDENLGKEALETMLAPGHPYQHPDIGTESGLKTLTLQDCIQQRRTMLGQARLILGMAGGYDEASLAALEKRIATLPQGDISLMLARPQAPKERQFLVVEKPAQSVAVSMGFNIDVKRGDPDFYALRLAAGYFGEHRQQVGRLFDVIREKRGMNYGNYAYVEEFVQEGWGRFALNNTPRRHQHFEIWLRSLPEENTVFAVRAALWQLDELVTKGLSKEDFESTREYLTGYSRLWEQTADRKLGYAIDGMVYGMPDYLEGFRKAMATMTREQVNAAIKKHLGGREPQIALVTGDGAKLKAALVSGKPTPPVYTAAKPANIVAEDEIIQKLPLGATDANVKIVKSEDLFD